ncbi:ATP-binding protein [Streptomyces sp. NPDC053086]|uniref:sensor histidine kinase n=1 Tax=unclassified Streptomyces TaxID=2593676 RepID=UPI0037D1FCD4
MTAPTHPGDRPSLRTFVSALAVTGVLSALVVCAAVAVAPGPARTTLAWGGAAAAVVLSAAVATAAHARRTARDARHRLEGATQDIGRLLQQQARTTEEARQEQQRLIDELARQRTEFTESFAAERSHLEEAGARELDRLRQENARLSGESEQARRERAAAISATSSAAARMQALATATLADLRAMEDRHTDEDVLADLLHLDHRTAQAGRLADSIAVLTGARSGRRWARPIGMESILRGAMGRIAGYQRVRVHSVSETAVAGHAAEGVMHALAELLDNAANFSPPTAEVHVYVEEVPAGAIVSVEDSGLVMGEVQLRRAERAVAGDVSELGGLTGTRLGLAVVGRLARKHGLKVSFRPSARGGTGVLMLIPQDILSSPVPAGPATAATRPENTPPAPAPTPAPALAPAPAPAPVDAAPVHESAAPPEEGPAGLPKRRRGRTLAAAERARSASGTGHATPATDEGRTRAARFSSFRQAVRPSPPPNRQPGPPTDPPDDNAPPRNGPGAAPPRTPPHATTPAPATNTTPHDRPAERPTNTTPHDRPAERPTNTTPHNRPAKRTTNTTAHNRPAERTTNTAPDDRPAVSPRGAAPDGPSAGPSSDGAGEHGSPAPSHPHAHPEGDTTS